MAARGAEIGELCYNWESSKPVTYNIGWKRNQVAQSLTKHNSLLKYNIES